MINNVVAMNCNAKCFTDWRNAKASRATLLTEGVKPCHPLSYKWIPPKPGTFKFNTNAVVKVGSENFSVGLILRDQMGSFVPGKVICVKMVSSVFEVEAFSIHEGLQWLLSLSYQVVEVESDSLISVQALKHPHDNHLEVGYILDSCHSAPQSRPGLSVSFAKRKSNKAAHFNVHWFMFVQFYFVVAFHVHIFKNHT